jgi:hypothetical protein
MLKRFIATFLIALLSCQPAFAHRLLPYIPASNANAVALIRHLNSVPSIADQGTIANYFGCVAPLPTLSLLWVNGYTQDAASWNWANVNTPRISFPGATWDLASGGYRGDGASVYGSTGIFPGADSNISASNAEIFDYVVGPDQLTSNPAGGAGASGGSNGLWINGPTTNAAPYRLNSATNNSVNEKIIDGYYEASIASGNVVPSDDYEIKDGTLNFETGNVTAVPTSSEFQIYKQGSGSTFGELTLGAIGYGAGDTQAQEQARDTCVTNLLVGLNITLGPFVGEPALPAYYTNPWSGSPTFLFRTGCGVPLASQGDTNTSSPNGFNCWPGTDYHNRDPSQFNGTGANTPESDVNYWYGDWGDRFQIACGVGGEPKCNQGNLDLSPQPKDGTGNQYREEYSTEANADAAETARTMYALGATTAQWQAALTANDGNGTPTFNLATDVLTYSAVSASPSTYFTTLSQDGRSLVTVDKFIEPDAQISFSSPVVGAMLDYEVATNQTDVRGLIAWANGVHSLTCYGGVPCKTMLYLDEWTGTNVASSGLAIPANIEAVKGVFDYIMVELPGGDPNYTTLAEWNAAVGDGCSGSVKAILCGTSNTINLSQIIDNFGMQSNADSDAIAIYNQYQARPWKGHSIWPERSIIGGATHCLAGSSNKLFSELTKGTCP